MFEFLRKMIGPIMLLVLVAFIATIIFSWGGGGFREKPKDTVGVIDGENISIKVYDRYYTNMLRQAQEENDYELPPGKIDEIRKNAWQQLLSDYLINREIEKHGIFVTSEEIYSFLKLYPPQELQSAPQFMTDGAFDYQKYINAMMNPENAPFWASIENYVLPDLKKYKLQEQIIGAVRVTPAEVMESFLEEKEKAKIGYLNIKRNDFRDIVPDITDDDIKQYYDAHKEDYKIGERASVDYVMFKKEPSENDWQKIRYEIQDIYDSAAAGADFAELAQFFSEDNSASNGGDLGWFARGQMVPAFDSAVFSMKVGDVSPPIRTRFGWHVIKLLGIKGEERNAAHILLKVESSQETLDQYANSASDFARIAREEGFEKAAEDYNYEILTCSSPFEKSGFISSEIGRNDEISEFALNNKVGQISDAFEGKNAFFVVKIKEQLPAGYRTLEDVAETIKGTVLNEKAEQMAYDSAMVVLKDLRNGMSFSRAANKYGFPYESTDLITRNSVVPNVGRDASVNGAAFALENINDISEPIKYRNGVVLMKLLERVSPDLEEFNQAQDSLRMATLQKKQQDIYRRWYNDLINNADVISYLDEFYRSY